MGGQSAGKAINGLVATCGATTSYYFFALLLPQGARVSRTQGKMDTKGKKLGMSSSVVPMPVVFSYFKLFTYTIFTSVPILSKASFLLLFGYVDLKAFLVLVCE